jgi:hypothetical protein
VSACARALAPSTCLEYWLGELAPAAEAEVEEHLLACAECSARTSRLARLGPAVRDLVRRGALPLCLPPPFLERLEDEGVRVRHHRVDPGGSVRCTAGPDDDLVSMRLAGDFRPGERVDLVVEGIPDRLPARRRDVPVDPERGELVFVEPGDVIRALPAHVAVVRVYGVGAAGERPIGEYTLHHSPWPGR